MKDLKTDDLIPLNQEIPEVIFNSVVPFFVGTIFSLITGSIVGIISFYSVHEKKLNKELAPVRFKDIKEKEKIIQLRKKVNENKTCFCKKEIQIFRNRLKESQKNSNLSLFFENEKSLETEIYNFSKNINTNIKIMAGYHLLLNTIFFEKGEDINKTIFHELFHVASSYINREEKNKVLFSGLSQKTKDFNIGEGLNEGYTEILCERYFSDYERIKAYHFETAIAEKIELIIGQDKMEKYYFTSDLKNFIKDLSNYAKINEIMDFFAKLDFLHNHIYSKKTTILERNKIKKSLLIIQKFLITCYLEKINTELKKRNDDQENFDIIFNNFMNSLALNLTISNKEKEYSIVTNQKTLKKLLPN